MIKLRCLRDAVAIGLLVLFAAAVVWAEEDDILSGSDLLRTIRGKETKPAYEDIPKEPEDKEIAEPNAGEVAEPNVSEVKSEPAAKPEKPVVKEITSEPVVKTEKPVVSKPIEKPASDALLSMVPAESLFCVRVNNFEYTVSQIDQFMAGVSPTPMGLSMLVRMQMAQMLGSPMLTGVNMGGNFVIFAVMAPGQAAEAEAMPAIFPAGLVPISDYQQFVSGNLNIGEPDEKGVSKITGEGIPAMVVAQVGNYALISPAENYDKMVAVAKLILEAKTTLASILDADEVKQATTKRIWAYANVQLVSKSFGPTVSEQLEKMRGGISPSGQGEKGPVAAVMDMDFEKLQDELKSLSVTINPEPKVCNLSLSVLANDAATIKELIDKTGLKTAEQISSEEMKTIVALLPQAAKADFAGTYNLMDLISGIMAAMMPVAERVSGTLPEMDITIKSRIAFAVKVDGSKMAVDVAVPKEHMVEVATVFQTIPQKIMQQQQQMQEEPMMQPELSEGTEFKEVEIPQTKVQGRIRGTEVTLENASFENDNLAIYAGEGWGFNPSVLVFLSIERGIIPENQSFSVTPAGEVQANTPNVNYRWRDAESGYLKSDMVMQGYRLQLKFGQERGGRIPGEILFEIPDKDTRIEGRFDAELKGDNWKKALSNNTELNENNRANLGTGVTAGEVKAGAEAATTELVAEQLHDGYQKERSDDLDGAIKVYEAITQNTEANERYRAQAYYRLGMCYLKKDDKNQATEQFRRLVSDFPRKLTVVVRARKELRKLGIEDINNNGQQIEAGDHRDERSRRRDSSQR